MVIQKSQQVSMYVCICAITYHTVPGLVYIENECSSCEEMVPLDQG